MDDLQIEKIRKALGFYLSASELKDIPRTGWLYWGIDKNRAETVASHVTGTQQLAFAIWSEFDIPVNIDRVIAMLAFHETEETVIGDIPIVHELKTHKGEIGKIAVSSMTDNLKRKDYIRGLINEFEERKTSEAKYATFIDKLECDLQSKVYDEENLVDVHDQENNEIAKIPFYVDLIEKGKGFSGLWMEYGRTFYNYPEEFNAISEYAEHTDMHEIKDEIINKAKEEVQAYLDSLISKD